MGVNGEKENRVSERIGRHSQPATDPGVCITTESTSAMLSKTDVYCNTTCSASKSQHKIIYFFVIFLIIFFLFKTS